MKLLLVLLALTGFLAGFGHCARILAVGPMPSRSHAIQLERLLFELGNRGHHITYIAASAPKVTIQNLTLIELPGIGPAMMSSMAANGHNMGKFERINPWVMLRFMSTFTEPMITHILEHPDVKNLLASDAKFDLIFVENMMIESVMAGFSHKYKAPIVAWQPFRANIFADYLVGNPSPSSFVPDVFLEYNTHMSFFERVHNFLFSMASEIIHSLVHLTKQDALMRKYFGADLPPLKEIIKNTSLVLVNHHHSLAFPRPYTPNMIEVSGTHLNPVKELPKDLKEYMDNSKDGVVLFSFGSVIKSADMSDEKIREILDGFVQIKQNVIWKFEVEIEDLPKNVLVSNWLPQSDILAHPNLKLFITHGGVLSTTEALSRGVPIIGVPLMADQYTNLKLSEDAGWAKVIQYQDLTAETISSTIKEVISNPKYKETALEKSAIYADNPMAPIDTAIWWIEYVLRHEGAPHLRSAAQDLTWYQIYLLDVYAICITFVVLSSLIGIWITKAILRGIFSRFCSKNNKSKKNN